MAGNKNKIHGNKLMKKEQIILRDLTEKDLGTVVVWRNNPEVNRYLANVVKTETEAKSWFIRLKSSSKNLLQGIVYQGQLIGYCMVEGIDEPNQKCEVGVIIGEKRHWGKGIGKSVVNDLLSYCFVNLKFHRVLAVIADGNERSKQLFKGLGFKYEGTSREAYLIDGKYTNLLCFSLLEQEYKRNHKN